MSKPWPERGVELVPQGKAQLPLWQAIRELYDQGAAQRRAIEALEGRLFVLEQECRRLRRIQRTGRRIK